MKNKVVISMLAITLAAGIGIGTAAPISAVHTYSENPVSNVAAPQVTELSLDVTTAAEEAAVTAAYTAAEQKPTEQESDKEQAEKETSENIAAEEKAEMKAALKNAAAKKAAEKKSAEEKGMLIS